MNLVLQEKIEILPVSLLNTHRSQVDELHQVARRLDLEFGWHYLLDLTWTISHLASLKDTYILDAGAGVGVLQWYLAEHGARVLSIDRGERANLALKFRSRYKITGLRQEKDLNPVVGVVLASLFHPRQFISTLRQLPGIVSPQRASGTVAFYHQNLNTLVDIPSNSLDAIAAISSLEHNTPDELPQVVAELMRVLKPGGLLLATLGAASEQDWFHKPSQGWCYSEASIRRLFCLPETSPSNYDQYNELFKELIECKELRENLAKFYFQSGKNGMPWGKWDPQYQVAGVVKIKPG
jgi:SAM-dependent methyltransferase